MPGTYADPIVAGGVETPAPMPESGWVAPLARFFSGTAFPAFALGLLAFYEIALVALMLVPASDRGLGAFAADFRLWCLGFDATTGRKQWGFATGMLSPPLAVAATIAWLWRSPIAACVKRPALAMRPLAVAAALVGTMLLTLAWLGPRPARGEVPFPAEQLRTAYSPPTIRLHDQTGALVDLGALRGKVVLLTAIYASCPRTCPMILSQARRVVTGLTDEERKDLRVIGVTLDPEHDTREVLANLATLRGMEAPVWHLVTGPPKAVERTLDLMDVSRQRDPKTGLIDHANLFILVDRSGRLAYRFTLGPRQERWLSTALRILLEETPDAG